MLAKPLDPRVRFATEKGKRMSNQQQQDSQRELDQLSINTLRFLAVDGVQKANSGHPGAPLACAPIAYLLYHKIMKHDPSDPKWIDRDRFVISFDRASHISLETIRVGEIVVIVGGAGIASDG